MYTDKAAINVSLSTRVVTCIPDTTVNLLVPTQEVWRQGNSITLCSVYLQGNKSVFENY